MSYWQGTAASGVSKIEDKYQDRLERTIRNRYLNRSEQTIYEEVMNTDIYGTHPALEGMEHWTVPSG
jgi:hypothetical protein